jgi:formylglycine-generating enzyme required for sulfatase activity
MQPNGEEFARISQDAMARPPLTLRLWAIVISALWVLAGATAAGFPGSPSPFVQAAPAKTHSDMVLVPGGEFEMGSSERDLETAMEVFDIGRRGLLVPEMPRHRVKIDSFWIERYLVTNAQFRDFVEQYRQWSKGRIKDSLHNKHYLEHWNGTEPPAELGNVPAVNVSWYAAEAYCRWQGGHLPTEAQWDWAARGGQEKPEFPWGNEMPDDKQGELEWRRHRPPSLWWEVFSKWIRDL